jgi:hypothetical protein
VVFKFILFVYFYLVRTSKKEFIVRRDGTNSTEKIIGEELGGI